ncbi:probable E3 ubiquitin-protein ligase MGRN1 isoform X1 [Mercenaria mercenaria]|uniref:probable E3 ubiquitin-protein ligase MGRN1 isoform X1 n=1 Tax=Mercenaria mercenaria TaxID=6596 RepID=UPI00234F2752|nr:probable E3 ubiquitin-protein ligase MGRN1 isoform X1 [Mercenaria mercenaria]
MGAFSSTLGRRNGDVEVLDITSNNAYKYPPKSGNYFGTHFIMGGERFDMSQPESYLFGENTDLNFLGCKPVPFPYPPASGNEPTKTLKSLVNIRKDTLRLVRIPEVEKLQPDEKDETLNNKYNLEFTFDCDVKCSVKIMLFCSEEIANGQINYHPRDPSLTSESFHYKRGATQLFQQSSYVIDPSRFTEEELQYTQDKEEIPVVIQCIAEDDENSMHAHMTFALIERSSLDGCYVIKPLKQKQFVHGLCYLLQEIYGIENKSNEKVKDEDGDEDDLEDSGAECVICMSDMRDTLILPCRHLCLCSTCAESLRYQASSCPICRSPFRALLQIRAMRRKQAVALQQPGDQTMEETAVSQEGVPPGYEAVSLIEALNGPCGLPPLNTMEGIHVPPPSRFQTDTESRHKRRSSKKRGLHVETVKELMMSEDDKKIPEDKDGERTDTSVKTESSVPLAEPAKSPAQKQRNRSGRLRKVGTGDNTSLPRSPSSDQEKEEDTLHMVNEVKNIPRRTDVPEVEGDGPTELTVPYPHLTVSSENLADDEREDTSEGEIEPDPDYDLDEECCAISEERLDSIASGPELTETISDSAFNPPPDYATVMCEDSAAGDTEIDTDDGAAIIPIKLHLSTSQPSSTDSGSSNHSSHVLLPQSHDQDH